MSENGAEVVDDVEHHRFVYRQDGLDAHLLYQVDGDRVILVHTEVPNGLAGRGIGGRLVQAAVERVAASGEILVPWCSYARKWLTDHPDRAGRVDIDWEDLPGKGRQPPRTPPPMSRSREDPDG